MVGRMLDRREESSLGQEGVFLVETGRESLEAEREPVVGLESRAVGKANSLGNLPSSGPSVGRYHDRQICDDSRCRQGSPG